MDFKYLLILLFLIFFISSVHNQAIYKCDYNTPCRCPKLPQGQYCGGQIGCNPNNVYECNPFGGTCEYGYRVSCACCGKLTCQPTTVTVTKHVTETLTTSVTTTLIKTKILTVTIPVMTTVTTTETTTETATLIKTKTLTVTTPVTTTETTTLTKTKIFTVTTPVTTTETTTITKIIIITVTTPVTTTETTTFIKTKILTVSTPVTTMVTTTATETITKRFPIRPINDPGSPSFIKILDSITGILVIIFATIWVCLFYKPSQEHNEIRYENVPDRK
ncbi:hypothetical protein F8M41_021718 [Gigaspora margarita]|uniref:Uncharacterized protein n=1 Tax=Gigaspora margarita TaxID=4874 RepID=A0A8H4AGA8_GIGMA|nr:hypothetical protein F8M41_021718 [Gigaspora margarita]